MMMDPAGVIARLDAAIPYPRPLAMTALSQVT
jgi:hypothetical protein